MGSSPPERGWNFEARMSGSAMDLSEDKVMQLLAQAESEISYCNYHNLENGPVGECGLTGLHFREAGLAYQQQLQALKDERDTEKAVFLATWPAFQSYENYERGL